MLVWAAKDPDEVASRFIDWSRHPSWIDGGKVLCEVVTDEGQTLQQTATILIEAR
jgi:hypothetical protein